MCTIQDSSTDIPEEQLQIRAKCFHPSGAFETFRKEDVEQSIPSRFEQQVRKYPDRLALKTENYKLTYYMLNESANRIAHAVLDRLGERHEPILLLFEHDAPVIVSMFGVLKAGRPFIYLDSSYPKARIDYIMDDSKASLLLTNNKNLGLAGKLTQTKIQLLNIDELNFKYSDENPNISILPDAFSSIFYTSGSTGMPKGVVENHRNVLHFTMTYTNGFHICREDRQSLLSPCSFSDSELEIFSALLNGGALFPFDIRKHGLDNLVNWLIREKITIYKSVPMIFRYLTDNLTGNEIFPHLRLVWLTGDRVDKKDVDLYRKHFALDCLLRISFGATEAMNILQIYFDKESEITDSIVPAGYPVEDKEVLLVDNDGREVGFNQPGEIVIKSRYLSPGYWRRPDLTKAKFLSDPNGGDERIYFTGDLGRKQPDGCLFHLGRKDFQVKVRGLRVEVAEIEAALKDVETIKDAVVVARDNQKGEPVLIAYFVSAIKSVPNVSHLRQALSAKLPDYMIPSIFVSLDTLPLNTSGKVDRQSLPEPDYVRPVLENQFVPPQTLLEQTLAEIWVEVLGLDRVGIHDGFLELGGNSLLATRIVSRILKTFQLKLSLQSLLAASTISEMAVLITQNQAEKVDQEELDIMLAELENLSDKEAEELTKSI